MDLAFRSDVPLAVVGMSCRLPGAADLDQYWRLIESGADATGELPREVLDRELYYDPRKGVRGKSYTSVGGMCPKVPFDNRKCRIAEKDIRTYDPAHLAMGELAHDALCDAGYDPFHLPIRKAGVYFGHTCGSSLYSDIVIATYVEEVARYLDELESLGSLSPRDRDDIGRRMVAWARERFDHRRDNRELDLASNRGTELIARSFGLDGPCVVVDAACASSLLAMTLGARALQHGAIDMAVVGGASYMKCASLVLFSAAQSVAEGKSCPFDARATGLVTAEGYVAIVLKTLARAVADGDRIRAVVRRISFSADGRGKSLWAPLKTGQVLAMRRAYRGAVRAEDIQYLEAHATSTQVGDATELAALAEVFPPGLPGGRKIALGSVKANIGHTLETAGMAGLAKVVLAMEHGAIPPVANLVTPNPALDWDRLPFYLPRQAEPWERPRDGARKAAVNSFGIGGLNIHVVLEEHRPGRTASRRPTPSADGQDAANAVHEPIAVIGAGTIFPGAHTVEAFLELLATGRDPKCDAPPDRWNADVYYSAEGPQPYRSPTKRGGFITDYHYDWRRHRVPPKQVENANPLQFMLLDATEQALRQAGYLEKGFDRERTGVVIGTLFGGDFSNQLQIGLRLPEFERHLRAQLQLRGVPEAQMERAIAEFEDLVLRRMPALLDETGSFTSSTLASRITKTFDLKGGGLSLDAGLGSGLAALGACADMLRSGDCDLMICAAGQRHMDVAIYENICRAGDLAIGEPAPAYDSRTDGYVPGEGCVVLLLKRLSDAQRDGDRVLAVVRQVAAAADFDAPGKALRTALERAVETAEALPEEIRTVEAVGAVPQLEACEVAAVRDVASTARRREPVWINSLAPQFGLVGGAHALAGVVKAAQAAASGTVPAGMATKDPRTGLFTSAVVRPQQAPVSLQPLDTASLAVLCGRPKGVSYAAIVEPVQKAARKDRPRPPKPVAAQRSPARLVRVGAADMAGLAESLRAASPDQLFAAGNRFRPSDRARLAIVCHDRDELASRLRLAAEGLGDRSHDGRRRLAAEGVYFGEVAPGRRSAAIVFPGQGSQYAGMLSSLIAELPEAAQACREADAAMAALGHPTFARIAHDDPDGLGTDVWKTQAAMLLGDFIVERSLRRLGLAPAVVAGHSFGEYPALVAAGAWSITDAIRCAGHRAKAITDVPDLEGCMAATNAPQDVIEATIASLGAPVSVANLNAPEQTVLSGRTAGVESVVARLKQAGHTAVKIKVPYPFHSAWMRPSAARLAEALPEIPMRRSEVPVIGVASCRPMTRPEEFARSLIDQFVTPVNYPAMLAGVLESRPALVVEAGPQQVLTKLNRLNHPDEGPVFLAADDPRRPGAAALLGVVAQAECLGCLDPEESPPPAATRRPREARVLVFDATERRREKMRAAPRRPAHAVAPAEEQGNGSGPRAEGRVTAVKAVAAAPMTRTAPVAAREQPEAPPPSPRWGSSDEVAEPVKAPAGGALAAVDAGQIRTILVEFVVEQTGYPEDIVELDADLEADLGIDSIKKAQLFGEVGERFRIAPRDDLSLDDFPTLRHVLQFLVTELGLRTAGEEREEVEEAPAAVAQTVAAPAATAGVDAEEIRRILVEFVVEQTGYPEDIVELDADLEADLGIDSIKKAQLFGEVGERFRIAPRDDLSLDDFPTLRRVLEFLVAELGVSAADGEREEVDEAPAIAQALPAPAATAGVDAEEIRRILVEFVVEQTGYPEDIVELDADLEADLGIDSIKKAQLFGEVGERFRIAPRDDLSLDDFPTLGHVLQFLVAELGLRAGGEDREKVEAPPAVAQPTVEPAIVPATLPTEAASGAAGVDADEIRRILVEFVVEQTGYPEDIVELDADLEADLGIDSIKKAQLFGEVGERFRIAPRDDLSLDDFPTLGHVLQFLVAELGLRAADEKIETPAVALPAAEPAPRLAAHTDEFLRVEVLEGTPREMGLRHGRAFSAEIRRQIAGLVDAIDAPFLRNGEVWQGAALEELRGLAEGASINVEAVEALNLVLEPLGAWRASFAKGGEHAPGDLTPGAATVVQVRRPAHGLPYLLVTKAGQLLPRAGVNAAGLAVSWESLESGAPPSDVVGLAEAIHRALSTCRASGEARARLAKVAVRGQWCVGVAQPGESGKTYLELNAGGAAAAAERVASLQQREFHRQMCQSPASLVLWDRQTGAREELALAELLPPVAMDAPRQPEAPAAPDFVPLTPDETVMRRHVLRMADAPLAPGEQPLYRAGDLVCAVGPGHLAEVLRPVWEKSGCHTVLAGAKDWTSSWPALLAKEVPTHLLLLQEAGEAAALDRFGAADRFAPAVEAVRQWIEALERRGGVGGSSLVAVTRMGGDFGFHSPAPGFSGGGLTGLFKGIRREFPGLAVKVLDFEPGCPPRELACALAEEMAGGSTELEVGFRGGRRHVVQAVAEPVLRAVEEIRRGSVWVLTGGGRGVTAAVARELGRRFGASLHLLGTAPAPRDDAMWRGRSEAELKELKRDLAIRARQQGKTPAEEWQRIEKEMELDRNLRSLREEGVRATYHSCDVTDFAALQTTLAEIRRQDGPIEGVVHGAGVESACRFLRKQPAAVRRCISVKCDGAANLMALTRQDPLRHFVGFGSTSGRFGGMGQADYSLASDLLAKMVGRLAAERPDCRCVAMHWPAWDEVGMAVRPESKMALKSAGLAFMPVQEGTAHLLGELVGGGNERETLVLDESGPLDVDGTMVRGRAAEPRTASRDAQQPGKLLDCSAVGLVQSVAPGAGPGLYVATVPLDPDRDPFLVHHRFKGTPFLPAVMYMEAFVEAAKCVEPGAAVLGLSDVRLIEGLSLPPSRPYQARVLLERRPEGLQCRLVGPFLNARGQVLETERTYATALVELGEAAPQLGPMDPGQPALDWFPVQYTKDAPIVHGPPLQTCKALVCQRDGARAKVRGTAPAALLGPRGSGRLALPCAELDGCLFACGVYAYCMLERVREIPAGFGHYRQVRLPQPGEECVLRLFYRGASQRGSLYDFFLVGAAGDPILEVQGYQTVGV